MESATELVLSSPRNTENNNNVVVLRNNKFPVSSSSSSIPTTPPLTPKLVSRSETNPYPTTFVQADTSNFKQVVQMLTGSAETAKNASDPPPCSAARGGGGFCIPPKRQGFKPAALYERRNSLKNGLRISPLNSATVTVSPGFSPRNPEILSPSILDFPSLALSPVTPPQTAAETAEEEEKAIAEKKFYLLPSPRDAGDPPQLLPLFPVTSPRVSESN